MNNSEIEKFKHKLALQKKEIQDMEATLEESRQTVVLDQSRVGRVSRMDAMQGQQMALEASRRRQQQLKNIALALQRIEEEEYGYCQGCGEPIDTRRLDFDPANALCIKCAE